HLLIERDPHGIIEGTLIAAYANQVAQAFIFVRGEFALGLERMQAALNEAYRHGAVGRNIFGSGFSVDVVVHPGAGAYIAGEETGLLESLEGKRAFPRIKPPYFPAAIGLYGEPTIVNNTETMANLPWIVLHGGHAFAALGEGTSTGTRVFALSGHVRRPGNYELEMAKTTFRDLIFAPVLGGGMRHGRQLKAFIPGGVSAPWFGPDKVDLPLDQDAVGKAGSMLGSGSVVVMDDQTCVVRAAWRIVRFFYRESCGQCTPCREGAGWVEMVVAAAERAGTYIPRFCYHPRMKPVGMCRMCLVEIRGPRGYSLQPACFVAVADGQEVRTTSDKVKKAQDGVLEFLLINHPLDCPVCDKGGECPLQDQTLAYGPGESRFVEEKRHFAKPIPISGLVDLDRERCIQCARCTRFADEHAGEPLINFIGRGDQLEVNTYPDHPFASYFSGNTVQICPVGALTAAPYRFRARPWDLEQ